MKKLLATSFLALGTIILGCNTAYAQTCESVIYSAKQRISNIQSKIIMDPWSSRHGLSYNQMTELADALKYARSIYLYPQCHEAIKRAYLQEAIDSGERVLNTRPTYQPTTPPKIYVVPAG
ncbi:MAG: hypothetical protein F6K39_30780 [Okeania sp. SIO3B3]|nr:hypothetical protein [Okeania sp. SIO3B3]